MLLAGQPGWLINRFCLLISCLGIVLAGLAGLDTGVTGLALVGLGMLLGMAFMGFQYGFASGWRRFLETGDGSPLSLHFLLAALCALMFIPVSACRHRPVWVIGAGVAVAFYWCLHVWHRHAACQWLWVWRVVQLWWRLWPYACGTAHFLLLAQCWVQSSCRRYWRWGHLGRLKSALACRGLAN